MFYNCTQQTGNNARTKQIKLNIMSNKAKLTDKQKVERKEKYLVSDYYLNVNKPNQELKKYSRTLGGCRAIILNSANEVDYKANFLTILKRSKKSEYLYKELVKLVKTSKSGNYGTHALLRTIRKHESDLLLIK